MMPWYYHVLFRLFWFFIVSLGPLYQWYADVPFLCWYHYSLLGLLEYFSLYIWRWRFFRSEDDIWYTLKLIRVCIVAFLVISTLSFFMHLLNGYQIIYPPQYTLIGVISKLGVYELMHRLFPLFTRNDYRYDFPSD